MTRVLGPRALTPLLALAGVAVAGYLTLVHYRDELLVCAVGGCERVQQSRYAEIAGVPIAILGAGMYLVVLALAIGRWRRPDLTDVATVAAFGLTLAGSLYSAYLTYVEVAVIDAICQWCVVSAALTVAILIVEGIAVIRLVAVAEGDG